jgi:hypothetical protein
VVERTHELFAEPKGANGEAARIAELERLVGQQAMELAVLKKASSWPTSRSRSSAR